MSLRGWLWKILAAAPWLAERAGPNASPVSAALAVEESPNGGLRLTRLVGVGEGVDARQHAFLHGDALPTVHQRLLRADGERRGTADRREPAIDRRLEPARGDHLLDKAHGEGLGGSAELS